MPPLTALADPVGFVIGTVEGTEGGTVGGGGTVVNVGVSSALQRSPLQKQAWHLWPCFVASTQPVKTESGTQSFTTSIISSQYALEQAPSLGETHVCFVKVLAPT